MIPTDPAGSGDKNNNIMATFKNYEIEMFGIKFNAKVERKNRKHGESVRIILADQYGFEMYKWISFHSAKEAAISAICAWKSNIPGFEFPSF